MFRLGIDVGGTFTDVILMGRKPGEVWAVKVPTTPHDPSVGLMDGIQRILEVSKVEPHAVTFVGHGTTIATNLLVEGKGAKTALIATKGFRDILELRRGARHDRADLYDMFFDQPKMLVPRFLRRELDERTHYDGTISSPIDHEELENVVKGLSEEGVEAIAISLLHSYRNRENEEKAVQFCRENFPDIFSTASFEVNPEILEYERTSTTALNATLGPRCSGYIWSLEKGVGDQGIPSGVHLMQSNGGLTRPQEAANTPVTLLESGPAGGVTAASKLCERLGIANAITGDVGGTTFDVSLIRDFRPEVRTLSELERYAVRVPTIDIASIGAGGGSIASVDVGGGLHVGPKSAGADPGPACYGRGGTAATVTDCNLILGYLSGEGMLGGYQLDRAAAEEVVRVNVAEPLGMSVIEAARTVRAVANANMAQAMRLVTIERGYDPRDFAYICFGGGGPVHAVDVARELEVSLVIVPPFPGLFSALGMLVADMLHDFQSPVMENLEDLTCEQVNPKFEALEKEAFRRLRESGVPDDAIQLQRLADCRYLGQAEDIRLDVKSGTLTADDITDLTEVFAREHKRQWNFTLPDRPVLLVNLRLRGIGQVGGTVTEVIASSEAPEPSGERRIVIGEDVKNVPVYQRSQLAVGQSVDGPAIIEEPSTNMILDQGDKAQVDEELNLIVNVRG